MNSTRSITLLPFTPRFRPRCARPPAHLARRDSTRHHHDTHSLADPARIHCSPTTRARPALTPVEPDPGRLGPLELRSEEHTSELQSLMRSSYAVFCLQKKNIRKQ